MRTPLLRGLSWAALSLAACAGCTDALSELPRVTSVDPPAGPNTLSTKVAILGDNFLSNLKTDFSAPDRTRVENVAIARLGPYDLIETTVVTDTEMSAVVPAGLPLGLYSLTITDGLGRVGRSANAYEVRETTCRDLDTGGASDCEACAELAGCECDDEGRCAARCGDGQVRDPEACDDGNPFDRDGCSADCELEPGFDCTLDEPSVCLATCGDALEAETEACDDGDLLAGDGCSPTCTVEPGWTCAGDPGGRSTCSSSCGDGARSPSEGCDDGNSTAGDGCSASCIVEPGWGCPIPGRSCVTFCGDGLVIGLEDCDDRNTVSGDGCGESCEIEEGFFCSGAGVPCRPVCGDSRRLGDEDCDDGNIADLDGCSRECVVEAGYSCPIEGEGCRPICNDGILVGQEGCDDGNVLSGDGCSFECAREPGWSCGGAGVPCSPICGDGLRLGREGCDDTNTLAGDGCSPSCTVEPGYSCPTPGASCATICGDRLRSGEEGCDDGNVSIGDGCDATCEVERGFSCPDPGTSCAPFCGDHLRVGVEGCDDGNVVPGDGCSPGCAVELGFTCGATGATCSPICGDLLIVGDELCDDGNQVGGDGCGASCGLTCGNNQLDAGEECDDGNRIDADACEADCTAPRCGNSILDLTEECDDGNLVDADTCESDCTTPRCGNAIRDPLEACDDGNTVAADGCENDCSLTPTCTDGQRNGLETGVDCGGSCPTPCLVIGFSLLGAEVVPDSQSPSRGECVLVLSGSRTSFSLDCTHDVVAPSATRIERGAVGTAGTLVMDLGTTASPLSLSRELTPAELDDLLLGLWSVVVTSAAHPGGDLRGQVATKVRFPLVPRQVVPPVLTNSSGTCRVFLGPGGTSLVVSCSHNLGGAASAARLRLGAGGENGPAVLTLASASSPILETFSVTPADAASYAAGGLYLSIETAAYPAGEVRGQLAQLIESRGDGGSVVPASASTARAACRSFVSPDRSQLALTCDHDVAGVTGAALRRAAPGVAGELVQTLGTGASPISTVLPLSTGEEEALQDGDLYLELTSAAHPAGDVRVQLGASYTIYLSGRQHIPERATTRTGLCRGYLSPRETTVRFRCEHDITDATIAHMHRCAATCSGVIWTPDFPSPISPFEATVNLTVPDVADLMAGNFYLHVHSTTFAGAGEIRGQVMDTWSFALEESQVVPASGSAATGSCFAFLGFTELPPFALRCTHDVAGATGIDLRRGAPGANGQLIQVASGTGASPLDFTTMLSAQGAADVRSGNAYVEVRSAAFPAGELRGRIGP